MLLLRVLFFTAVKNVDGVTFISALLDFLALLVTVNSFSQRLIRIQLNTLTFAGGRV